MNDCDRDYEAVLSFADHKRKWDREHPTGLIGGAHHHTARMHGHTLTVGSFGREMFVSWFKPRGGRPAFRLSVRPFGLRFGGRVIR